MKEICDKEVLIKSQTLLFFSFCYKRRTLLFLRNFIKIKWLSRYKKLKCLRT